VRARSEQGFTLIEVLIATALMSIGIAATMGVFGASGRATLIAQQNDVAASQAQATIDELSRMDYDAVGLTSTPASSTDPKNPGSRVSGSTLTIKTGLTESFVLSTDAGQSGAAIDPTPQPFTTGSGSSAVSGKIYQYVTWRDENCASGTCDGTQNTKRLTVAVTIDQSGTNPVRNPVWLSEILPDPNTLPPGSKAPPSSGGTGAQISAQNFYLYDTPCSQSTRQAPTASHVTDNTASYGVSPNYYPTDFSTCENATATMRPDLMGPTVPTGSSSTPLYTYSSDLGPATSYSGGLAMKRGVTACPTYYYNSTDATVASAAANQWSVHEWNTAPFAQNFGINGQATVSIFSSTLGGATGKGVVCAMVVDRLDFLYNGAYYPFDRVLGSSAYSLSTWPTTTKRLSFTFDLPDDTDVYAGHRLALVLAVMSTSDNDLNFVYDHPTYPSFVEIATDTPF
jgi:prepilin-type N-terminal cleavage/methylation domain-containing protein